jgi:hypothetical protein
MGKKFVQSLDNTGFNAPIKGDSNDPRSRKNGVIEAPMQITPPDRPPT